MSFMSKSSRQKIFLFDDPTSPNIDKFQTQVVSLTSTMKVKPNNKCIKTCMKSHELLQGTYFKNEHKQEHLFTSWMGSRFNLIGEVQSHES